MFVARPNNRMPLCWNELRLQADGGELVHEPSRAVFQLFFVLVVGGNTRKTKERIIILKVIIAHGHKLIGFRGLPTISAAVGNEQDT
jgi:hypothetical protein